MWPLVFAMVVMSIWSGAEMTQLGYYTPYLIAGACYVSVGAGILSLLDVNTTKRQWLCYQVIYGLGLGLGCLFQLPSLAAQTVLARKDVSIGVSLMLFGQTLFGAIFVSVGQNVLAQHLAIRLARISGIRISPEKIEMAGVTGLFKIIPSQYHGAVLDAYNSSLRLCFLVALVFACLSFIGSLGMEWHNLKEEGAKNGASKSPTSENAAGDGKSFSASSDEEGGR
jgi:hypothetical protein